LKHHGSKSLNLLGTGGVILIYFRIICGSNVYDRLILVVFKPCCGDDRANRRFARGKIGIVSKCNEIRFCALRSNMDEFGDLNSLIEFAG
jgi:hypothetical protein